MYTVGIKELKSKLSYYMGRVKRGEPITVTERGRPIATIVPSGQGKLIERLAGLTKEGFALWQGGKPSGSLHPAPLRGKPISKIVLEGRR